MIDVLIPVLGRPETSGPLVENIIATSRHVKRILFLYTPGDSQADEVKRLFRNWPSIVTCQSVGPLAPGDYARKTNAGFRTTDSEFVFVGASDLRFHDGWDEAALDVAHTSGVGVIGTDDMANPQVKAGRHATHPLIRRSYIDEVGGTFDQGPGVVYFEGYDHQAVDNELCIAAQARGQWAFAKRSRVQHLHPIYDRSVAMDATYKRALANGKEDIALLKARMKAFRG